VEPITDYNFAKIDLNWGESPLESQVEVTFRDIENKMRAKVFLRYKDLVYDKNRVNDPECYTKINRRFKTFSEYFDHYYNHQLDLVMLMPYVWCIFLILFIFLYLPYFFVKNVEKFAMRGFKNRGKEKVE
jgi:hypothetical protein